MNKILSQFGFAINNTTPKKKEKRTSLVIYLFEVDGTHMTTDFCKPNDLGKVVKSLFERWQTVTILNVKMLNGHTKIIRRNESKN